MPPPAIEAYRQAFEANALTREQFSALLQTAVDASRLVDELRRQVEWFKRQLFSQKSERRLQLVPDAQQGSLGQAFDAVPQSEAAAGKKIRIEAHERVGRRPPAPDEGEDLGTFFDEAKVPVEVIELAHCGASIWMRGARQSG